MHPLINALGFQSAWWACIAGVGHGLELPALAYCSLLACLHLAFTKTRRQEVLLAAISVLAGLAIDSMLQALGFINFYGWSLVGLSPFWLWALWVLFAMTLNSSLAFLQNTPWVMSAILGALFGPLTYYAGAQLGAAAFDASVINFLALALTWMCAMPAHVLIAKKLYSHERF